MCAAVGVGLVAAAPSSGASRLPGAAPYGLVASNVNFLPGSTFAARTANYRRLFDAGVRAVRMDINWAQVEPPGPPLHDYSFGDRDREVAAARAAGLQVYGILGYGHPDYSSRGRVIEQTPLADGVPPFAVGNAQYYPPDDPASFGAYARATAAHYGRRVMAWEIWNEENEGWRFWPPREDPAAYARLLCAAYHAVKAANPRAVVVFGGVFYPAIAGLPGTSGPDFVQQVLSARPGVGRCFDALGYHPYPYPFTSPEVDVPVRGSVLAAADEMRAVLRRNGLGRKPLWITELGWPTSDRAYGVSEEKQAEYLARTFAASFAQRLPVVTWYTYGDDSDPTGGNQEAAFGLFRADGSPKPAYRALSAFTRLFKGTRFRADRSRALGLPAGALLTGGRGFALEYARRGARVWALWYASESAFDAQGPLPQDTGGGRAPTVRVPVARARVALFDYLGRPRPVRRSGGRVTLALGPAPVYLLTTGP
jgi:polysaccharide biosynthesis protein PslG